MTLLLCLACGEPASQAGYRLARPDTADHGAAPALAGDRFGAGLTAADLDEDGVDELIVGSASGVWLLDGADLGVRATFALGAAELWSGNGTDGRVLLTRADWDSVLQASTLQRIDDPAGEATITLLGTERVHDAALADLDGDALGDLLVASGDDEQGIQGWSGVPQGYATDPPALRLGPVDGGFLTVLPLDVDGDGITEVLGGAWRVDDPSGEAHEQGAVYVFDGELGGNVAAEDARAIFFGAAYEGDGYWLEGQTGRELDAGGDLDGDGLDEVLVGGRAWLWVASMNASGSRQLDEVALARFDGEEGWHDEPGAAAAALDFNEDGAPDLAVGAPAASVEGIEVGATYLIAGPIAGRHDLGEAAEVKLAAATPNDELGAAIAVVRQPDGAPALAVGAPGTQAGSDLDAGAVWLWTAETLRGR